MYMLEVRDGKNWRLIAHFYEDGGLLMDYRAPESVTRRVDAILDAVAPLEAGR
jgi:hypothetical protein